MKSYFLYMFFITTLSGEVKQVEQPQEYANKESCTYAASNIVQDLKPKLSSGIAIQTYCLPKDITGNK